MYDANGDGVVSVLEMMGAINSGDFSLSPGLEEEVAKLADIMEHKRFVTRYGGGFIDLAAYQTLVSSPAFSIFFKERLVYNYKNMGVLYQKRYEQLIADN